LWLLFIIFFFLPKARIFFMSPSCENKKIYELATRLFGWRLWPGEGGGFPLLTAAAAAIAARVACCSVSIWR
jgi:hypothetical protein